MDNAEKAVKPALAQGDPTDPNVLDHIIRHDAKSTDHHLTLWANYLSSNKPDPNMTLRQQRLLDQPSTELINIIWLHALAQAITTPTTSVCTSTSVLGF